MVLQYDLVFDCFYVGLIKDANSEKKKQIYMRYEECNQLQSALPNTKRIIAKYENQGKSVIFKFKLSDDITAKVANEFEVYLDIRK